jgi:cysteine desulfurase
LKPVYLDCNATAPIRPEAAEAAARALAIGGNPSSVHAAGRAARAVVEQARAQVAVLVAARPEQLVFVSGGAEANALAIESAVAAGAGGLIIGRAEHASVMQTALAAGTAVEGWPVLRSGVVDLDWLASRRKAWPADAGAPFVAVSLANNETGVIQPVAQVAEVVHAAGGWLHVDAVQAAGKIAVDFQALGADTLVLSAHKLGGPQGVAALVAGPNAVLTRQQHGGGQERGLRAGTENLSGIAGFGAAALAAARDLPNARTQAAWRDDAQRRIAAAGPVTIFGAEAPRLPTVLCFAVEGFDSERQVMALDLEGVMVSAGAACSSGKVSGSDVVAAMGFAALARSSLRVSGGWATTENDWARFAEVWLAAYGRFAARRKPVAA